MLRIDGRSHRRPVTQHTSDLGKRRAFPQYVGCQAVPQNVRAEIGLWWADAGRVIAIAQNPAQDLCVLEPLERRLDGDEQRPIQALALILDVIDNRLANFRRHWHPVV